MSLFDSVSNLWNTATAKVSSIFTEPTVTKVPTPVAAPKPVAKTTAAKPVSSTSFFDTWSLGGVTDFLKGAGEAVKVGAEGFFGAKSQYNQLQTAQEIEKIKLDAILTSSRAAPAAAQIILPTFSDFLNDPREAASRVTPAALAGSGVLQGGMSLLTIGLAIGAVVLLARSK